MGGVEALVFLDVDGVLNGSLYPAVRLHPDCCRCLMEIVVRGKARVVISSTWRHDAILRRELYEALCTAGDGAAERVIVGATPDIGLHERGVEIQQWLLLHGAPETRYVVLDDLPIEQGEIEGRGVWTDPQVGLQQSDVERALVQLSRMRQVYNHFLTVIVR